MTFLGLCAQEALRQAAEAEEREKAEQAALSQAAVDLERLRQVCIYCPYSLG